MKSIKLSLLVVLVMTMLAEEFPGQSVFAHTGALHNATEKRDIVNWGASAYIQWTNPDLDTGDGGWAIYHRVATVQWSPWRFVEFGWRKTTSGFSGLIAYDDGSGGKNIPVSLSAADHRYHFQYDPNTGKYWFGVDGSNYWSVNANFSDGDAVIGGGEVGYGVESMGHTKLWNLRWLKRNPDGTFVYVSWDGHANSADDSPYYNTDNGLNSFYDDGDGHS